MLNQEQINGKWDEIKGGIRNIWGKITDEDLEQVKGNIQSVPGIVQQKYIETKESIKHKLDTLMDTFDNETDKSLKLNDGISSYERSPTDVRTSQTSQVQDLQQDIKTRSPERKVFENSEGGAINSKQGVAANQDNRPYPGGSGVPQEEIKDSTLHFSQEKDKDDDDEYSGEEIFDDSENEDSTYQPHQ